MNDCLDIFDNKGCILKKYTMENVMNNCIINVVYTAIKNPLRCFKRAKNGCIFGADAIYIILNR